MQLQPVITIPQNAESISIGEDGTVSIQPYGNAEEQVIGQLLLTRFVNYADSSPWVRTCTEKHLHRERQSSGYQMKMVLGGLPKVRWSGECECCRRDGQHDRDTTCLRD